MRRQRHRDRRAVDVGEAADLEERGGQHRAGVTRRDDGVGGALAHGAAGERRASSPLLAYGLGGLLVHGHDLLGVDDREAGRERLEHVEWPVQDGVDRLEAAASAPATISSGARSPPIASTATADGLAYGAVGPERLDLAALVGSAGRADVVRPLRLVALRAPTSAGRAACGSHGACRAATWRSFAWGQPSRRSSIVALTARRGGRAPGEGPWPELLATVADRARPTGGRGARPGRPSGDRPPRRRARAAPVQVAAAGRAEPGAVVAAEDLVRQRERDGVARPGGEVEATVREVRRRQLVRLAGARRLILPPADVQARCRPPRGSARTGRRAAVELELEEQAGVVCAASGRPPGSPGAAGSADRRAQRLELDLAHVPELLAVAQPDVAEVKLVTAADGSETALQRVSGRSRRLDGLLLVGRRGLRRPTPASARGAARGRAAPRRGTCPG